MRIGGRANSELLLQIDLSGCVIEQVGAANYFCNALIGVIDDDGEQVCEPAVAALEDASLSYSDVSSWTEGGRLDGFLGLARSVWRTRAYGDFWSHVLVAEGAVDISAEPEVSLWDLAALQVIVEEAGGIFTDLSGKATPDGGSAVCTNGRLHGQVLEWLAASS